jgi:6-phosphogluconolactonase
LPWERASKLCFRLPTDLAALIRVATAADVAVAAVETIVDAFNRAVRDHGTFRLVLAGGSTPRAAYSRLAAEQRSALDWSRFEFYFGDERCVPPDDERSNYRMARDSLLEPLGIQPSAVHRMAGEIEPEKAAAEYHAELRELLPERASLFDLVLLGLGPEGHTASLFPGAAALGERSRLALAVEVAAEPPQRITLTPVALARGSEMLFMVAGTEKADAVAAIFARGEDLPAARVAALAPSRFLVDEGAARGLPALDEAR